MLLLDRFAEARQHLLLTCEIKQHHIRIYILYLRLAKFGHDGSLLNIIQVA